MTDPLRVHGLSAHHGPRAALEDVDFDVAAGSTVAVIGPNGSGKSTLLRVIAGLHEPATGRVERPGGDPAIVFQTTDVDRSVPITVLDTVRLARYAARGLFGRLRAGDHAVVQSALDKLAIDDLAHRQLHELSGGQRQRVFVAQGLAQDAGLLLLDEPLTGLDVVTQEVILDVVAEERDRGRIVAMTTHDLDDARRFDRVLLLATRQVAFGRPEQVLTEDHLLDAFGGRSVLRLAGGELLVDDPHHDHG